MIFFDAMCSDLPSFRSRGCYTLVCLYGEPDDGIAKGEERVSAGYINDVCEFGVGHV